jgi:hypothetical protein
LERLKQFPAGTHEKRRDQKYQSYGTRKWGAAPTRAERAVHSFFLFGVCCFLVSLSQRPDPRPIRLFSLLFPSPPPLILSLFPQVALKSTNLSLLFFLFSPPPPVLPTYLPTPFPPSLSLSLLSSASRASLRVLASASFARGGIPQVNNPCLVSPSACWISFALRVIRGISNRPYAQKPRELSPIRRQPVMRGNEEDGLGAIQCDTRWDKSGNSRLPTYPPMSPLVAIRLPDLVPGSRLPLSFRLCYLPSLIVCTYAYIFLLQQYSLPWLPLTDNYLPRP